MAKERFYEDVEIGTELTPLIKHPIPRQFVKWAGASGDYAEIHYSHEAALANGQPGVIAQGKLNCAWLGQLVIDWIGEKGVLRKITCQYRGMDLPGDTVTCKGEVTDKYIKDGEHCVECRIWTENQRGATTTPGTAIVILPSRG